MSEPGPDKVEALVTLATMDRLASLAPEQRAFLLDLVELMELTQQQRSLLQAMGLGVLSAEEVDRLVDCALGAETEEARAVRVRRLELADQTALRLERDLMDAFRLLGPTARGYVAEGVIAFAEGDLAAVSRCFVKAQDQVKQERQRAGRRVRPAGWSKDGEGREG